MINKTIKTFDKEIIYFMYPTFKIRTELDSSCRDKDVIYIGKFYSTLKEDLKYYTRSYISLVGVPDIDVSSQAALLRWAVNKKGSRIAKKFIDSADSYDQDLFSYLFKIFWITGKWEDKNADDSNIYEFYETFGKSVKELIYSSLKELEETPYPLLESSLMTFFLRVSDWENQQVNPQYKRLLRSVNMRIGKNLKKSVLSYSSRKELIDELRLISLLLDLRAM